MFVNKYNIQWQLTRTNLKKIKNIEEKFLILEEFYNKNFNLQNKTRIINWIKGLIITKKYNNILNEKLKFYKKTNPIIQIEENNFILISDSKKIEIYKDLYKRNIKWLKNGYINKDLNDFLLSLYNSILLKEKIVKFNNKILNEINYIKENNIKNKYKIMKKLFILLISVSLFSCTNNSNVKHFGGKNELKLKTNEKLINITWKENNMWILTEDTLSHLKYFREKSEFFFMEGEVIIK